MATKIKSDLFPIERLTATQWDSAETKSKFGKALVRFVLSGFDPKKWNKKLYTQLSMCFGHIAEYNMSGFYSVWFADANKQRAWVKHIVEPTCYGDPAYTYSDLERMFQRWIAANLQKVQTIIDTNVKKETLAIQSESGRMTMLEGQTHQQFKVVGMSSNTGSFGHHQFIMLAKDGTVYAVQHIQCNGAWRVGQVFNVELDAKCCPTWRNMSVECPSRKPNCPPDLVAKMWG